jgi:hypothetical protein
MNVELVVTESSWIESRNHAVRPVKIIEGTIGPCPTPRSLHTLTSPQRRHHDLNRHGNRERGESVQIQTIVVISISDLTALYAAVLAMR